MTEIASIFPGYLAYSLRIDTTSDYPQGVIEHYTAHGIKNDMPVAYYFFGHEVGKATEKPHFQGVVWYPEPGLTSNNINNIRNNLKRYCHKHLERPAGTAKWQPTAIALAKKNTLASYCTKEHNGVTTNMTQEQIALIPQWIEKGDFKKRLSDKLDDLVVNSIQQEYNGVMTYNDFVSMYADHYFEVYDKYCTLRNTYFKAARKYNIISTETFLYKIGVVSDYTPSYEYENQIENLHNVIDECEDKLKIKKKEN